MNLQPLNNRIIVKPDPSEEVSPGGIVIPSKAQEASRWATVVAAMDGCPVAEGDRVMIRKGTGVEIKGGLLILQWDKDLFAVER